MLSVGADTVAVGFYLGVLLMATTVVVLTIIFMTKPKSEKIFAEPLTQRGSEKEIETEATGQTPIPSDMGQPLSSDQNHITLEQIDAVPSATNSENRILGLIRRAKSGFKIKISFPNKRVKNEAKVSPQPNEKTTEKDTLSSPETSHVTTDNHGSLAGQPAGIKELPVTEEPPKILSEISIPKADVNNVPSTTSQETNNSGPVGKEPEMKKENKPEVNKENKNVTEPPKSDIKQSPSEPEPGKSASAGASNTPAKTQPQEHKTANNELSELFTNEIAETNETGKLAEKMEQIDVNNLLREGLDLINMIKKPKS